jgi:hypothetical protein
MNEFTRKNLYVLICSIGITLGNIVIGVIGNIVEGDKSFNLIELAKWSVLKGWYFIMFAVLAVLLLNFFIKKRAVWSIVAVVVFVSLFYLARLASIDTAQSIINN